MTAAEHAGLLARLRADHARRLARQGDHGPVVKTLHDTADLMDAWVDGYERRCWQDYARGEGHQPRRSGRLGWPWGPMPAGVVVDKYARLAAWGLASWDDWPEVLRGRLRRDGVAATREWNAGCEAVHDRMSELLFPAGASALTRLTSADVRAAADRLVSSGVAS